MVLIEHIWCTDQSCEVHYIILYQIHCRRRQPNYCRSILSLNLQKSRRIYYLFEYVLYNYVSEENIYIKVHTIVF